MHRKRKKYKLVATAFSSKNRVVAVGQNDYQKSHPLQRYFAEKAGKPDAIFLHAEIAVLIKCRGVVPHSIRIVRTDSHGNTKMARPCKICMEALSAYGINSIEYTTNDGFAHEKIHASKNYYQNSL